jgi:glycosyltransferase involved in cell wall biosynthesis
MRAPAGFEGILHGRDTLILHSGWVYHNVRAARVADRLRVPYVLTPHGAYDPNVFRRRRKSVKRLWWNLVERRLIARARAVHVFFDEQREELQQLGYGGAVIVAPTGLTIPELKQPARRSPFILWMGRFDIETKGIDLMLQALALVRPAVRPRMRLHGPDWHGGKQQVTLLVRDLGLQDFVTIGPALYGAAKWDALCDCSLFVFASRWEGQGLMPLEAAAAGAPLVVTNTTLVGRLLAAADAATLVDPTPEAIAAGILASHCSSDAMQQGARASEFVRQRFSWPAVAASYADQLRALL